MKKLLLTLGSVAAVVAPVASVVACGNKAGIDMAFDLSGARTLDQLVTKLQGFAKTTAGKARTTDSAHTVFSDGPRHLDITVSKGDSQDKLLDDGQKLIDFFKAVLADRGITGADLVTDANKLQAAMNPSGTN